MFCITGYFYNSSQHFRNVKIDYMWATAFKSGNNECLAEFVHGVAFIRFSSISGCNAVPLVTQTSNFHQYWTRYISSNFLVVPNLHIISRHRGVLKYTITSLSEEIYFESDYYMIL